MTDVNSGLRNLTQVTQGLVTEVREMRIESREITAALLEHDDQAKAILALVSKPAPKPRAKKTVANDGQ
jgi:predicted RNA-binding protein with RPS1 domain